MPKKPFSEVERSFLKFNYIVLTPESEYRNVIQKLDIKCDQGHKYQTTYNNFQKGRRCPICAKEKQRKFSYKIVYSAFAREGYTLLTPKEEYINSNQSLDLICPVGHKIKMTYHHFYRGNRCLVCYHEKLRLKRECVYNLFESRGYSLVTPISEYRNTKQRLELLCPCGEIFHTTVNQFDFGHRCNQCYL